ncbi:MAG: DUF2442 domain-containing protein [Spirochaetaceae bacterium]|jgi:hypothetical protein|nr:DUF2442 domain-containing protein [Spirochaetaceae bacterium]
MILHVTGFEKSTGYKLNLRFNNGESGTIDFKPILEKERGQRFQMLLKPQLFNSVRLEQHTLQWANGADFAPEHLLDLMSGVASR